MADITLKAMPFDSQEFIDETTGETYYDRVAYSKDFADLFATYFSNGILVPNGAILGTQLQVTHTSGMNVSVNKGALLINGRTGWNEEASTLTLDVGGSAARIDRIIAELNIPNDRGIYIKVLKGVEAEEPEAPELTQTDDVYQISLAKVNVAAGLATIEEVIDERDLYISNVLIGVQPPLRPTGDSADNIKVTDETALLYDHTNTASDPLNVDEVLAELSGTSIFSSYLALVGNINTNMVDAALGKNNEENIRGVGRALALYSRWIEPELDIEDKYPNLLEATSLVHIVENVATLNELATRQVTPLLSLLNGNAYAANVLSGYLPILNAIGEKPCPFLTVSTSTSADVVTVKVPFSGYYIIKSVAHRSGNDSASFNSNTTFTLKDNNENIIYSRLGNIYDVSYSNPIFLEVDIEYSLIFPTQSGYTCWVDFITGRPKNKTYGNSTVEGDTSNVVLGYFPVNNESIPFDGESGYYRVVLAIHQESVASGSSISSSSRVQRTLTVGEHTIFTIDKTGKSWVNTGSFDEVLYINKGDLITLSNTITLSGSGYTSSLLFYSASKPYDNLTDIHSLNSEEEG